MTYLPFTLEFALMAEGNPRKVDRHRDWNSGASEYATSLGNCYIMKVIPVLKREECRLTCEVAVIFWPAGDHRMRTTALRCWFITSVTLFSARLFLILLPVLFYYTNLERFSARVGVSCTILFMLLVLGIIYNSLSLTSQW